MRTKAEIKRGSQIKKGGTALSSCLELLMSELTKNVFFSTPPNSATEGADKQIDYISYILIKLTFKSL